MRKILDSAWHRLPQVGDSNLLRVGRSESVLCPPTPHPRSWIPKGLAVLSTIHMELHISDPSQKGGYFGLDPCFPSFLLLLSHSFFAFS